MECWHFLNSDKRLAYGERTLVVPGKTYSVKGPPILCEHGFHGSKRALDALHYAPGLILCRVVLSGEIVKGNDKVVATERTVIWMADATKEIQAFSRFVALSVGHWWDMPQCVRDYLVSGDEILRDAAEADAWAAARAARAAARAASAAEAASWAAWAAESAAWAARDAAWAARAAWAAARAARDAAWAASAAWAAARAARDAAWAASAAWAARDAVWDELNEELEDRLMRLAP